MYGDTGVIRGLARALRERATDIRHEADRLVALADSAPWSGQAADALRHHARDRAVALRRTAVRHDDAADALDRHADEVDHRKELIAAVERRVTRLVEAARDRLAALGHGLVGGLMGQLAGGLHHALPDPADQLLDRFVPPPSGSKEWLDVDLPGLHR